MTGNKGPLVDYTPSSHGWCNTHTISWTTTRASRYPLHCHFFVPVSGAPIQTHMRPKRRGERKRSVFHPEVPKEANRKHGGCSPQLMCQCNGSSRKASKQHMIAAALLQYNTCAVHLVTAISGDKGPLDARPQRAALFSR